MSSHSSLFSLSDLSPTQEILFPVLEKITWGKVGGKWEGEYYVCLNADQEDLIGGMNEWIVAITPSFFLHLITIT